ncbi:MAG: hypothetical protein JW915_04680 [Chitinispirillaceae bacterium]|nr:hypothetical protein [Chitinispirillaceae bacterium]
MPRKPQTESKSKTQRIEVRLSTDLKNALEAYCEKNLESIMETANRAIKEFVGFGQNNPQIPQIIPDDDLPKNNRLEIRVHSQLKQMILDTQKQITATSGVKPNISSIILSAIIQYIGYNL